MNNDGLKRIKRHYNVPAVLGQRVQADWLKRTGTVVGSDGAHLQVTLDGESSPRIFHPLFELSYLGHFKKREDWTR